MTLQYRKARSYGPRVYYPRQGYRKRRYDYGYDQGYTREETRQFFDTGREIKRMMKSVSYFGNTNNIPTRLPSTAMYSVPLVFITEEQLQTEYEGVPANAVPYGFAQIVLCLQHTQFMMGLSSEHFDRVYVRRIDLEYVPTGTESLVAQRLLANGNALFSAPPYSNTPVIFTYDPTADVSTREEALKGMKRFDTGTPEQPLFSVPLVNQAVKMAGATQLNTSQLTKTHCGTVYKPRYLLLNETGSFGKTESAPLDIATQYKLETLGEDPIETQRRNQGKLVATYGTFNVILPRVLLRQPQQLPTPQNVYINILATFELDLYGHR